MKLYRNEDGTLVDDEELFYVRKGHECGFTEDEMVLIENIRRNNHSGMHMCTEDALKFARDVIEHVVNGKFL